MKTKAPKTTKQIDRWYAEWFEAENGEAYKDPPTFSDVRRDFERAFKKMARLRAALNDPFAPGAAEIIAQADLAWEDDFRDDFGHLIAGMGEAIAWGLAGCRRYPRHDGIRGGVVVIDEDEATRTRLKALLEVDGPVHVAADIRQGIELVCEHGPAVILAGDAPGMSIDALATFRYYAPRGCQVVFLTGEYDEKWERLSIALGAFAYLETGDDEMVRSVVAEAASVRRAA